MKLILVAALAMSLAGCKTFENLIVRSLDGDRAFVASMYGPLGLTAELRAEDAAELQRLAAMANAIQALRAMQPR